MFKKQISYLEQSRSLSNDPNLEIKEILNTNETCLYLGISKSSLYKLTHKRKIPYYCPEGKLIYFQKTDLKEYILRHKQDSIFEINSKARKLLNNKPHSAFNKI